MPGTDRAPPAPGGILFDLDETLIDVYGNPAEAWRVVVGDVLPSLDAGERTALADAIFAEVRAFLSRPVDRRAWRLDPVGARPPVVARALVRFLGPHHDIAARDLAHGYEIHRRRTMALRPGAAALLARLKKLGIALALVTNGRSDVQRHKIAHFGLDAFFDHIQIEEEAGYGKPDPQAFLDCVSALGAPVGGTWMVGDDLYYDIVPANRLGLWTFWYAHDAPYRPGIREPRERHRRIDDLSTLLAHVEDRAPGA